MPNKDSSRRHSYYNFNDEPFKEFMLNLLMFLEVKREENATIIIDENCEWEEVIFFQKGVFACGFSINKQVFFPKVFDASNEF